MFCSTSCRCTVARGSSGTRRSPTTSVRPLRLLLPVSAPELTLLRPHADIGECVKVLRDTAEDEGLAPIPIFGNGDAYDWRTYWDNVESSGVDGIMIARGALIKPWCFTEIKERRDCASTSTSPSSSPTRTDELVRRTQGTSRRGSAST